MKLGKVLAILAVFAIIFAVGCSSGPEDRVGEGRGITGDPNEPSWVSRGSGEFPGDVGKALYAVGMAGYDPNPRLQDMVAKNTARTEMARQIETYVAAMMKDFMQSHKDFADPKSASSIQFVQAVSKSVTEATLVGSKQINAWREPQTKTQYVLMTMPLKSVYSGAGKKAIMKKARERQAEVFKAKADEALKALDGELEKRRKAVEEE